MTALTGPRRRQLLALTLGAPLGGPVRAAPLVPLFVGTGPPSDQTPEMLALVGARAGLAWDYRPTPWLRAQKLTAAGDGVMFGLTRTPQRDKVLRFSQPVWTNHTWAIVRDGEQGRIHHYRDLNGQVVCWTRGSSYGELFTHAGLGQMDARESSDDEGALRMAAAGRCLAALLTLESSRADQALRHPALAGLAKRGLALVPVPLAATPLHFATGREGRWAWAIDRINRVVSQAHGELEKMRQG